MTVAVDCAVAGALLDTTSMSAMATADNQTMDTRTRVTLLAIFIGSVHSCRLETPLLPWRRFERARLPDPRRPSLAGCAGKASQDVAVIATAGPAPHCPYFAICAPYNSIQPLPDLCC